MIWGARVGFRPVEASDQSFVHGLNADPTVRGNVVGWDWPSSLSDQERWFANTTAGSTRRFIVADSDGTPIGLTGLWDVDWHNRHALTALKIGGESPQRGRGFGSDAIKLMMAFAFYDVGLERLHSSILADNVSSQRAYVDRCGWSIEGTARQHVWRHGQFKDMLHVGVLKSDFEELPDASEYIERITAGPTDGHR